MTHAANVWNKFCQRFKVVEQSVPLFKADAEGVVGGSTALGALARPRLEKPSVKNSSQYRRYHRNQNQTRSRRP